MKIRNIESQLRQILPIYNDYFTDKVDVSTYTATSNVATVVTSSAHSLSTGDIVSLRGVDFVNPITSLTQSNGTGTAVLQYVTDYTYPYNEEITITGANEAEFNDTFNIISIPNRNTITFQMTPSLTASATGSPVLYEENLRNYNGSFEIASTPTTTSFTFAITTEDFTAPAGITYYVLADTRITAEISDERILEAYTDQDVGDWWLFAVADDSNTSRNKNISTDYEFNFGNGDYYRQQTGESVTIYVVIPTQNKISPVDAQDICKNELKKHLILSLSGYFPVTLYNNLYDGLFYQSDSLYTYDRSYYIHSYKFMTTVNLSPEDIYRPESIAIKQINVDRIDTNRRTVSLDIVKLYEDA